MSGISPAAADGATRRLLSTLFTVVVIMALVALPRSAHALTTGGSGGAFTDATFRTYTAAGGLTGQYHLYAAGLDSTRSIGLMIHFHGDGAYEFNNPNSSYSLGGTTGIRAQAAAHNMILLAAKSPDTQGTVTWWESGVANADYARDLITSVALSRYNIDTERIWLVGYSGGAQFVTQFLFPLYPSLANGGGAVVFGGGGAPRVTARPFPADLREDFPMHWYTGAADTSGYNALLDAQRGSEYYARAGFPTSLETPAGVGHDLSGRFGPVVGQQLALHDHPGPTFSDVPETWPFFTEVEWLAARGITTGYPDGTFRPLDPVNRDSMAAFLYRAAGSPSFTPPATSPFADMAPTSAFYKEVTWLHSRGVCTGWVEVDGTRTYRPQLPITRDAMAAFLYRFAGSPRFTPPAASPFTDMTPASSFYKEVTWMASTGITKGWPDGTFRPGSAVTRDAMAAFLYRLDRL